ncbi:MAG: HAD-IA family hydrolase [Verrucomicrobiota bacterium]
MTLKCLLFDFDGLILNTEEPGFEAWLENYRAYGADLPLETYVKCVGSDFNGFDPKSHLESLVDTPVDWQFWDAEREKLALSMIEKLEPLPGILDLIKEAEAAGIPCLVASSSPRSWVGGHLDRLGLTSRFQAIRCLEDVASPKPAPDLFQSAAKAAGVEPRDSLVLEDSLNGLIAATAAGAPCVVVPNRITRHLDFAGASSVLPSLDGIGIDILGEIHRKCARPQDF